MHDIYKFYMFTMYKCRGTKLFDQLKPIFKFFNKFDDINQALDDQLGVLYGLPYTKSNASVTHDQFFEFLLQMYPTFDIARTTPQKTLSCDNYECHDIKDYEMVNVDLHTLYNWLEYGKDISRYKDDYIKDRVEYIDFLKDIKQEYKKSVSSKNWGKAVRYISTFIANMKILNTLEKYYTGSEIYPQTIYQILEKERLELLKNI